MKQLNLLFIAFSLLLTGSAFAQDFETELDFCIAQLQEIEGERVDFLEYQEIFRKLSEHAHDHSFFRKEYAPHKEKLMSFVEAYWQALHRKEVTNSKTAESISAIERALTESPVNSPVYSPINTNTINTNNNHNGMNSNHAGSLSLEFPSEFGVQAPHMFSVNGGNSIAQNILATTNPFLNSVLQTNSYPGYTNSPYLTQTPQQPHRLVQTMYNQAPVQTMQQQYPQMAPQYQTQQMYYQAPLQTVVYQMPQQIVYVQQPQIVYVQQPAVESTTTITTTVVEQIVNDESSSSESDSEEAKAVAEANAQINAEIIGNHVVAVLNGGNTKAKQKLLLKKGGKIKVAEQGTFTSSNDHIDSLYATTYEFVSASYDAEAEAYIIKVKQICGTLWTSVTDVTFVLQGM